jgi:hypothetical protein
MHSLLLGSHFWHGGQQCVELPNGHCRCRGHRSVGRGGPPAPARLGVRSRGSNRTQVWVEGTQVSPAAQQPLPHLVWNGGQAGQHLLPHWVVPRGQEGRHVQFGSHTWPGWQQVSLPEAS